MSLYVIKNVPQNERVPQDESVPQKIENDWLNVLKKQILPISFWLIHYITLINHMIRFYKYTMRSRDLSMISESSPQDGCLWLKKNLYIAIVLETPQNQLCQQ